MQAHTTTTWVIKLSKFCNMRCRYCYEWNELGDRARMSMDLWERILQAMRDHKVLMESKHAKRGLRHENLIVFHGGEPLALPTWYWKQVLERLGQAVQDTKKAYRVSVQTNLFSFSQEKIDLLREHGANLSVSFDLVPGVRLNVAGQPTEATVSKNIDALRDQGIKLNAIAVLAKHTLNHVTKIHDFFAERQMGMRMLPLFDGPAERDLPSFWLDHGAIRRGLETLFCHWVETGCQIPVHPLNDYFESALRHMAGLYRPVWSREHFGDGIFLVNVDGTVYRVLDAYQRDLSLGNLADQSISAIIGSDAYGRSMERDRLEFAAHCNNCEYLGACSGAHYFASRVSEDYDGLCPSAHACISFMIKYVKEKGYGPTEIRTLMETVKARRASAIAADAH